MAKSLSDKIKGSQTIPTGLVQPIGKALPPAVDCIVQSLHPKKIILFGSFAYGNPTEDSDVDLLVIMDTNATETERYVSVSNLLYPRTFPVDILVKTPGELDAALAHGDFFLREITQKGIVLYE